MTEINRAELRALAETQIAEGGQHVWDPPVIVKLLDALDWVERERDSANLNAETWAADAAQMEAERDAALARAEATEAQIAKVRGLHENVLSVRFDPNVSGVDETFEHCIECQNEEWPCPTIAALAPATEEGAS